MEREYNTRSLPLTLHTVLAELHDAARPQDGASGGFTVKRIKGRRYWYRQQAAEDGVRRQVYLGAETPELMAAIAAESARIESARAGDEVRRNLVMGLRGGGFHAPDALTGRTVKALADAGVFENGGVLIGSNALGVMANMLGVALPSSDLRTEDVDIVQARGVAVASGEMGEGAGGNIRLEEVLKKADPRFASIPGLDARELPTSFRITGGLFRVDMLAPVRRRDEGIVPLPHLGVGAKALPFLEYLVEKPVSSVMLHGAGIPVAVPSPARFALHKLLVAGERPAVEQAKVRKDLAQAGALLEVLVEERPHDVKEALADLMARGKGWRTRLEAGLGRLPESIRDRVILLAPPVREGDRGTPPRESAPRKEPRDIEK